MTPEEHRLLLYYVINVATVTSLLLFKFSAARDAASQYARSIDQVSRRYTPCLYEISSSTTQDNDYEAGIQNENRKRSRSAGTSTTGSKRRNVRRRVSVAEGMASIEASMKTATSKLLKVIREATTNLLQADSAVAHFRLANVAGNTNLRVPVAIALIVANEGLSDSEIVQVAEFLIVNPNIATIYVSLTNRAARSRYIRKKVDGFRTHGTVPLPTSPIVQPATN